jgi:energy-coupling factor transporter ATP-binding protein EcfA2
MNPSSPQIPLAISLKDVIFHGKVYYERINRNRLSHLILYEGLREKFDKTNYAQQKASQYYENENQQLINYKQNYKKHKGAVPVRYFRTHKSKIGRVYPDKSLGLTTMCKKTRNTLINDTMIDIDMQNAQLQILRDICHSNNIDCQYLDEYSNNREPILGEMMDKYGLSRNACKKLFIRMTLGGTFRGFCYDNNIDKCHPTDFIVSFQKELDDVGKKLIGDNTELWRSSEMKILKENKKIRDTNAENGRWNNENPNLPPKPIRCQKNPFGSFLSKILQEWEVRILECMYIYLRDNTDIVKGDYFIYEFDGCKLLRDRVEKYGVDKLIDELEGCIISSLGFNIKLEQKPMDKIYEDFYCEFVEDDMRERKLYEYDNTSYDAMKSDFEEENCKIVARGSFLCKMNNNRWALKKRSDLLTMYEHLRVDVIKIDKKTNETEIIQKSFIDMWLKDINMKRYQDVDVYPPPLRCPENMFNLWTPFKGELLAENGYNFNQDAIDMIEKHMLIMCNNDKNVCDYLRLWIGQMLKYPAIKTNVPIFTGKQGSGKSSIFNMISAIIGKEKCVDTTSPDECIWGKYNGVLADSYFVVINELEKKQMANSLGQIKGLVTDGELMINAKGVPQYKINSFHRFGMTTNKEDPFTTSEDDRRTWIVRTSDELIGNKDYFEKFHNIIQDEDSIATLYNYFYNVEGVDNFNNIVKPVTEYQQILIQSNGDIIDDFWKSYTENHYYDSDKVFEVLCSVLYSQFRTFCKTRGYGDSNIHANRKFFGETATHRIAGITEGHKTNKGNKKRIDINKLCEYYNINCLVKEDDSDEENDI